MKHGISVGHLRGVDANYRGSVAVEDARTEPVKVQGRAGDAAGCVTPHVPSQT